MGTQRDKLQRSLGGIKDMKKTPDLIFVIDTNYEFLAIKEAIKLNIPIIAILDTNSDPENIDFPIPGNDDARRSIELYCGLISETIKAAKKDLPKEKEADSEAKTEKKIKEPTTSVLKENKDNKLN